MENSYFVIKDGKVYFNYCEKFESGEDDCLNGVYNLEQYNQALNNLKENGFCSIQGEHSSITISENKGLLNLIFRGNKNYFFNNLSRKILA